MDKETLVRVIAMDPDQRSIEELNRVWRKQERMRYPGWSDVISTDRTISRAKVLDRRRRPYQAEYQECLAFASWLRSRQIFFFHYPAGDLRPKVVRRDRSGRSVTYSPAGKRLRAMGALDGVADYIVFDRPPAEPKKIGAVWEMKAIDGAEPTDEQYIFLEAMLRRGWATGWGRGFDQARAFMESLGY